MPKKTLTRNEKTGAWDSTKEALPSEIEQKKVGTKPTAKDVEPKDSATKSKTKVK